MKEDYDILNKYLRKKKLVYSEFNQLIGNYFVEGYEELDENYYLLKIITPLDPINKIYTDYKRIK